MPAPAISHLICTSALIILIIVMPVFYSITTNNIQTEVIKIELKEIADYVSNTLANLYFLVNSTNCLDVNLTKELVYLPSTVENYVFVVEIWGTGKNASKIVAYLKYEPHIRADAWLVPGLYRDKPPYFVESGSEVIVGCSRNATGVYVWIDYAV